jgi:hypothetical protein
MSLLEPPIRRRQKRLKLQNPLFAELSIHSVADSIVITRKRPVLITELGAHGLLFTTNLQFPVRSDYVLAFDLSHKGKIVRMLGRIVWRLPDANWFVYGVSLLGDEQITNKLMHFLNVSMALLQPGQRVSHETYRRLASATYVPRQQTTDPKMGEDSG